MSKNTKTVNQPLSAKAKTAIWITGICAVAIVVLVVSLVLIFNNLPTLGGDDDSSNSGSTTTDFNGSFLHVDSDITDYPQSAQNWDKKTYQAATSDSTHNFGTIGVTDKVLMGVVNTENWDKVSADLAKQGLANVSNPKTHDTTDGVIDQVAVEDGDIDIANVYMIATLKGETNASIHSAQNFSISALTSKKITVWLNTTQLTSGNAVIRLQASNSSALQKHWYAYDDAIVKTTETTTDNGWTKHELYIFNRASVSKTVRVNIGLGNVYTGANAEGILFIDDISHENVTANEYRLHYSDTKTTSHIIPATDTEDTTIYNVGWTGGTLVNGGVATYETSDDAKVDGLYYSPFISSVDTFDIFTATTAQTLVLENNIDLASPKDGLPDYIHAYFWVRVIEGTTLPQADAIQVTVKDDAGEELKKSSNVVAIKDIVEDTNSGWQQFHVYVKPDPEATTAKISISLDWVIDPANHAHDGKIYASNVMYEFIDNTAYSSSTSGTKLSVDMSTAAALSSINGSFSVIEDVTNVQGYIPQPENWTPVYAGSNTLYNDGLGNKIPAGVLTTSAATAGSGIVTNDKTGAPLLDDAHGYYLNVVNAQATSHGYLSNDIALSANSVYQISVVAKGVPYIYLLDDSRVGGTEDTRKNAILASFEGVSGVANNDYIDDLLAQPKQTSWVRYYFIVETADVAVNAKIALFNGKLDGTTATGTVSYDQVVVNKIGSYALAEDTENEEATLYKMTYSASGNYAKLFGEEDSIFANVDATTTTVAPVVIKDGENDIANLRVLQLTQEKVDGEKTKLDEMRVIPVEDEEEDDEDTTTSDTTTGNVDLALLLSVISSVALVAALAVVVVIKMFKRKRS